MNKVFFEQIKDNRFYFIIHLLIVLVLWFLDIAIPYVSGSYIDYIIKDIELDIFATFILLIAAMNIFQLLFKYLQSLVAMSLTRTLAHNISGRIFQKLFATDNYTHSNIDNSFFIDQINNDSRTVARFFETYLINSVIQVATIIVSGIIIFQADPLLSIIVLLLIPFYVITFTLSKEKLYASKAETKAQANEYFSSFSEQITKLLYIKRNSLSAEMAKRFSDSFGSFMTTALRSTKLEYIFSNLNQLVVIVAYLCVVSIGGYKVSVGALSIGYFSIINTYLNMIIRSISFFRGFTGVYQDTKVSLDRINTILNDSVCTNGSQQLTGIQSIHVKDLCVQYNSQQVISHFNYSFNSGEIYGIKGRNGSGKTTLLNALMGIYAGAHSGNVLYNDINISELDMFMVRRKHISYVEQDPVAMNLTVAEYLSFGIEMTTAVEEKQSHLLSYWNVRNLLTKNMQENGSNLSGGEKQKLALVRVLSKDSTLLLLDEPTSALDRDSTEKLMHLLNKLKKESIVIIISHDQEILQQCDNVIEL